jgi:predicted esterase
MTQMPLKIMKHSIKVDKTATYHSSGDIKSAKTIWFVLHGYGMLSKYFIKKFDAVINDTNCVIAPEGLSKFYTKGFHGRVGATWMTKENREEEIEDYINYLNKLYDSILKENSSDEVKINIVGFSQGGATASRWVADGKVELDNFILWSTVFPDDMNFETFGKTFNSFLIYGNDDEFSTKTRVQEQKDILTKNKLAIKLIEFNGVHDVPEIVLKEQSKKNKWS